MTDNTFTKDNHHPPSVWRSPIQFVAFGFGSGLLPFAPGTWGTLVGVVIYDGISRYPSWIYTGFVLLAFCVGVWICDVTTRAVKVYDHPGIVWDEIVGYLITMMWVPRSIATMLIGFVLFRLFDILKPWPIRVIDTRMKGGWGVMLDDVLAALMAWAVLQGLLFMYGLIT